MTREQGFYWVKYGKTSEWEIMRWAGTCWKDTMGVKYADYELFQINQNRLRSPDEPKL